MKRATQAAVVGSFLFLAGCSGSDRALYPLAQGLTWEYQITVGSMPGGGEGQRATVTNLPERDLGGRKVTPQMVDIGQQSHFIFVVSDQTGIYEYARQLAGAVEPEILPTPNYSLKYPVEPGASWEGATESALMNDVSFVTQATIESMDETVTVPAGTFEHCVKIKTLGEMSKDLGSIMGTAKLSLEEHSWFCHSVGMAKLVRKEGSNHLMTGSGQVSMELVSFKK